MSINREKYICDGKVCLHNKKMIKYLDSISNWNGIFPDPVDNSPCDHCIKSS